MPSVNNISPTLKQFSAATTFTVPLALDIPLVTVIVFSPTTPLQLTVAVTFVSLRYVTLLKLESLHVIAWPFKFSPIIVTDNSPV